MSGKQEWAIGEKKMDLDSRSVPGLKAVDLSLKLLLAWKPSWRQSKKVCRMSASLLWRFFSMALTFLSALVCKDRPIKSTRWKIYYFKGKGKEVRNWGKYKLCCSYFQLDSRFQTWWGENVRSGKIPGLDNTLNLHILKYTAETVTSKLDNEENQEADKNWAQNMFPELRGKCYRWHHDVENDLWKMIQESQYSWSVWPKGMNLAQKWVKSKK